MRFLHGFTGFIVHHINFHLVRDLSKKVKKGSTFIAGVELRIVSWSFWAWLVNGSYPLSTMSQRPASSWNTPKNIDLMLKILPVSILNGVPFSDSGQVHCFGESRMRTIQHQNRQVHTLLMLRCARLLRLVPRRALCIWSKKKGVHFVSNFLPFKGI